MFLWFRLCELLVLLYCLCSGKFLCIFFRFFFSLFFFIFILCFYTPGPPGRTYAGRPLRPFRPRRPARGRALPRAACASAFLVGLTDDPGSRASVSEGVLHRSVHRHYLPATTASRRTWLDRPRGWARPCRLRRISARVGSVERRRMSSRSPRGSAHCEPCDGSPALPGRDAHRETISTWR